MALQLLSASVRRSQLLGTLGDAASRHGAQPMAQQGAPGRSRGWQSEQTKTSGVGASLGTPPQRECDQRAHASHAIMRCPSSSRVPHSQATTQSSMPPAGARASHMSAGALFLN